MYPEERKLLTGNGFCVNKIKVEKNEVYDYLAKVYLDKQPAADARIDRKNCAPRKRHLLFVIAAVIVCPAIYLLIAHPLKLYTSRARSLYLSTGNEPLKIKFDFTDSQLKKQGYTITLSELDAKNFKFVKFRIRRQKKYGELSLRIEMENNLKENASYYLTGLTNKWQPYAIALGEFREITQWEALKHISFIVEEWNAENKDDCVFIDEIRFTQEEGEG